MLSVNKYKYFLALPCPTDSQYSLYYCCLSFFPASLAEDHWADTDCPLCCLQGALMIAVVKGDRKGHG